LLLGQQKAIDPALWADFNTTQTSWLIVVSGSQITLLLVFVYWVSHRLLAPWPAVVVAAVVVVAYSLFVGLGLSVARAAVMGLLYLVAQGLGRPITPFNLLAVIALVLTALDPLAFGDIGFQFSFAAVAGILIFAPSWIRRLRRVPRLLGEAFALSAAAQTTVLPVVIAQFAAASLAGSIVGPLVGLLVAPLMILGTVYEFAAWLFPPAGQLIAWICWPPLTLIAEVVHWAAHWKPFGLPFNTVDVPRFNTPAVLTWYIALALLYITTDKDRRAAVRRFVRPDPVLPVSVGNRT
ncbi:MAG: ComEC/Rec2 family competence protein, partial [Chloroflexota bacterium]|nr:ComEC/Rec2 family competence protein [Chloroflexota bacterium]